MVAEMQSLNTQCHPCGSTFLLRQEVRKNEMSGLGKNSEFITHKKYYSNKCRHAFSVFNVCNYNIIIISSENLSDLGKFVSTCRNLWVLDKICQDLDTLSGPDGICRESENFAGTRQIIYWWLKSTSFFWWQDSGGETFLNSPAKTAGPFWPGKVAFDVSGQALSESAIKIFQVGGGIGEKNGTVQKKQEVQSSGFF